VSPASAAIDGVIGGSALLLDIFEIYSTILTTHFRRHPSSNRYPGNSSAEWESSGEQTTAWWGISWDEPYNITSVSLGIDSPSFSSPITILTSSHSCRSCCTIDRMSMTGLQDVPSLSPTDRVSPLEHSRMMAQRPSSLFPAQSSPR